MSVYIEIDLSRGLTAEKSQRKNSPFLSEAKGVVCQDERLREYTVLTCPLAGLTPVSPFPQLFFLQGSETILVTASALATINTTTWAVSVMSTYDASDRAVLKNIVPGGEAWHLADFGKSWILFNDKCTIMKTRNPDLTDGFKYYVNDQIIIWTGCAHQGRLVYGGVDPSSFWISDWSTELGNWWDHTTSGWEQPTITSDTNFVLWSSIGSTDLWMWLDIALAKKGFLSNVDIFDRYRETLLKNQFGFVPMPFHGAVLCVLPLGKDVIVYGVDGIVRLYPVSAGGYPTYGVQKIANFGIMNRMAVGGNDQEHILISSMGDLYHLTSEGLQHLGFQNTFASYVAKDFFIYPDTDLPGFRISIPEQNEGYILTKQGMSCIIKEQLVHGGMFEGEFKGIVSTQTPTYPVSLITSIYDFGTRTVKTIDRVESDFDGDYEFAISFRQDGDTAFTTTSYIDPNVQGVIHLGATGVEFKFHLRTEGDGINGKHLRVWFNCEDGSEWRLPGVSVAAR